MRKVRVALVALSALGVLAPPHISGAGTDRIVVDADEPAGQLNRDLGGLGWHPGGPPVTAVDELDPPVVRVDANLQDVSLGPTTPLMLEPLVDAVAAVRTIGAEPLVILSYMPAWLGAPNAHGRDPTRVPPSDFAAWEGVVHDVVAALARAPQPAYRFEAWNEPDSPIFWQDTPQAWSETIAASARAIVRVEQETGLDLAFGGPAALAPDPVYLAAFITPLRDDPTLPFDFVSWHSYANSPFFGPDGNEFEAAQPVYPVLGRRNPRASPHDYGPQVALMRDWAAGLLAGSGRAQPRLALDEWNLSAAGFDRRHDSHEGAAFDAATLVELHDAALDEAEFFQVSDEPQPSDMYGGHGLVTRSGVRKPAWWTFWLWHQLTGARVAAKANTRDGDVWAIAARDGTIVRVLVASFSASSPRAHTIDVELRGFTPVSATVRRIDADHPDASLAAPLEVGSPLELPGNSVAMLEFVA